jgi:hypothetical protein
MIARKLVLALAILHYAAWSGATVLTPPDIPEQPLIRTIHEWGDQIAVIAHRLLPAERRLTSELFVVDQGASRAVATRAPGCDTYHDVAYGPALGKLLLCGSGDSARVYRSAGASWAPISESVQGAEFRFAVQGERIAVVSASTIVLMSAAANGRPAGVATRIKLPARSPPSALLLDGDLLLMAYDMGEFGGGLYRMDLKQPGKPPVRLIDGNVGALARASSGVIWAAGGLDHLGSTSAAVNRIRNGRVEIVAAIAGFGGGRQGERITEKAGVPFPGLTSVTGLSLGRDGRPVVVLPEFGVFELAGDGFVALYEGSLHRGYQVPGVNVGSSPVGLAIGQSGEIYVAARSLGIFLIRKDKNGYNLKQLLFDLPFLQ